MKTKKLTTAHISLITESILQLRNTSAQKFKAKINEIQHTVFSMHIRNDYTQDLYTILLKLPQYNIEKKLNSRQHRLRKQSQILIKFILTDKANSRIYEVESWLVSCGKVSSKVRSDKINEVQQQVYLLQGMVRALRCQFLGQFVCASQQIRSKYIFDYRIEINPLMKICKKQTLGNYEEKWQRRAFLNEEEYVQIACYHNSPSKIKQILNKNNQQCRYHLPIFKSKRGSEDTKPSQSGQLDLNTSVQLRNSAEKKNSLIQFFDEELNITILSNHSQSFKKSTGKIEQIYLSKEFNAEQQTSEPESEGEFELLIQQGIQQQAQTKVQSSPSSPHLIQLQKACFHLWEGLDKELETYFFN